MEELTLKEIQHYLTDMLIEFDRVCRENGLRYSLAYGTLLGAVRHKGFIPWDDDVDVLMPRPDYERFISLVHEGKIVLSGQYYLTEDRGKKAVYPYVKMLDRRFPTKCRSHKEVPYLFLDIFPLDGAPSDPKELKKTYAARKRYGAVSVLCMWYTVNKKWGFLLWIFGFWIYLSAKCYGLRRAVKKLNKIARKYPFESSEKCGVFCWGMSKWQMDRALFEKYCDIEFEGGGNFMAIDAWDEFLTKCYGDYMTPPPEGKRVSEHSLRIYRK